MIANRHRLYVGTIGEGLWRSTDGGETFIRACKGMFVECHVRAIAVHPNDPQVMYLGSEQGLFRSEDGADTWSRVESPFDGREVWSIFLPMGSPDSIIVGICPSDVFCSHDKGGHWDRADVAMRQDCPGIQRTRVTALCGRSDDPRTVWAGVEIDGMFRSHDAGMHWEPIGQGLSSQDIHALAYVSSARRLVATTNNDVNISVDDGATWQPLHLRAALPLPYFRGLAQRSDRPDVLFLGNGDGPPGTTGLVARSLDGGLRWETTLMPDRANSTIWNFAVHPAAPDLVYASSVSGQVYRSQDGGAAWHRLAREFGEIRALAWTP